MSEGLKKGHEWWRYENLPGGAEGSPEGPRVYNWAPAVQGDNEFDAIDFHLDLGCGTVPKGRIGIDRFPAPGVDLVMDLETLFLGIEDNDRDKLLQLIPVQGRMPFPDNSIKSIISHHCLEHIGEGFVRLMDECHRILEPGGVFRIITPLFPSRTAVEDPDHKRYFMENSLDVFCAPIEGPHSHEGFSVPYTSCRFEMLDKDHSPETSLSEMWGPKDAREIRVALRKRG